MNWSKSFLKMHLKTQQYTASRENLFFKNDVLVRIYHIALWQEAETKFTK